MLVLIDRLLPPDSFLANDDISVLNILSYVIYQAGLDGSVPEVPLHHALLGSFFYDSHYLHELARRWPLC